MIYFRIVRKNTIKAFVWLLFILLFAKPLLAQTASLQEIEHFISSQRIQVSSTKDMDALAKMITAKYSDSLSRIKAAYVWVAKNITYTEWDNGKPQHTATNIDSVLKYKSTVCSGYVNLFCFLCEKAGIDCKEIDGFGRTGTQSLTDARFSINHAWAAVWLNGKWNLADPTWGSGYALEGTKQFISVTNEYYFFTEPETFILDHYPKRSEWQLLKDTVSWEQFVTYPGVCLGAKENEASQCLPAQSLIQAAAGSRVQFSFTSKKPLQSIVLLSKQKGFQERGTLQKKDDVYSYTYTIPAAGRYDLQIDLNNYDVTKPGTYSSLIDFVYFIDAAEKDKRAGKFITAQAGGKKNL